jgi:hypothetical protein
MPDDIYTRDILVWSGQQADLLRRLARGERVNAEIDWENVIEEVESVGRSELRAVESLLTRALEHLLKVRAWPEGPLEHWRHEALVFLSDAVAHWTPAMRQSVDIARLYRRAASLVIQNKNGGRGPAPLPDACPYTIDDLIRPDQALPDIDVLLATLAGGRG